MSLVVTPVFSVTWSFINHSNMVIWCSRNVTYYYQCRKKFMPLRVFLETVIHVFIYLFEFIASLHPDADSSLSEQHFEHVIFAGFVSAGCKDAWPVYVPVWSTDVLSQIDALECGQSAVFQDAVQTVCSVTHVLSSAIYCHWKVFASAATSCLRCTSSLWFWGWVEHVGTEASS